MSLLTIVAATGMIVLSGTQTTPVTLSDLPSTCTQATDECGNSCSKGENGGRACTKMACVTKKDVVCTKTTTESEKPTMCTMQYDPVCATKQVQCIKAPCDPIQQTYGNSCMATADGATVIAQGECMSDDMIVGNDQDEHGCIGSAGYMWNEEKQQCVRPREERQELVSWAHSNGLTKYDSWSDFNYDTLITREQAAKMIMSTITSLVKKGVIDEWMIKQVAGTCEWSDESNIDTSLNDSVHQVCAKGLMYGANKKFHPKGYMTDSDLRVVVMRMSSYIPVLSEYLARVRLAAPLGHNMTRGEFLEMISMVYHQLGLNHETSTIDGQYVLSGHNDITLEVNGTGVHAKFCNTVNGSYSMSGDTMIFGPMISTQMYCMQEGLMNLETSFGSLSKVYYTSTDTSLMMSTSTGGVLFNWIRK